MSKRVQLRKKMFNHIRRWQASSLSQRAYCKKFRIPTSQFYYWQRTYRASLQQDPAATQFLPVVVTEPQQPADEPSIIINCPNGMVISFPNTTDSVSLIRQLLVG